MITGVYARSDRNERPPMPVSHPKYGCRTSHQQRTDLGDYFMLETALALEGSLDLTHL